MPTSTVAFTVVAAVVAVSCDRVPLTSPTGSTILPSASTNIVPIDGSAEITATVTEQRHDYVCNVRRVGELDPDRDRHGLCWQCHNQPTGRSGLTSALTQNTKGQSAIRALALCVCLEWSG
ncbi:MAG: hypothetical protein EXQ51_00095 [Acidobacteria bacterium]|nr:hypothetical protein [Acidobacteriota bacterium]